MPLFESWANGVNGMGQSPKIKHHTDRVVFARVTVTKSVNRQTKGGQ